jgi:hypothetical protein
LPGGASAPHGVRAPAPLTAEMSRELLRSLERMEADLAELRAEVERMRTRLSTAAAETSRRA